MSDNVPEINIASSAPDFHLESNEGKMVSLSEYQGHTHVVLYFMREFN